MNSEASTSQFDHSSCNFDSSMTSSSGQTKLIFRSYYVDDIYSEFVKGREIGFGASCVVYEARYVQDESNEWPLALKIFNDDFINVQGPKYFIRELQQLIKIEHPYVVHLIKFSLHPETNVLQNRNDPNYHKKANAVVTKKYPNGSLQDAKKYNLLNPTIIQKAFYGIAAVMCYLHQNSILHRDLKLQNIFLDEKWEIVVGDLGMARAYQKSDLDMTTCIGTPLYAPPEFFSEETEYDESFDVYCYGTILYMIFHPNSMPVRFNDPKKSRVTGSTISLIKEGYRFELGSEIPEGYKDLIKKCWNQEPSKRPTFGRILGYFLSPSFDLDINGCEKPEFDEYVEKMDTFAGATEVEELGTDFDF